MRSPGRRRSALRWLWQGGLAVTLAACTSASMETASPEASVATSGPTATIEPTATAPTVDPSPSDAAVPSPAVSALPGCGTGESGFFEHAAVVDRTLSFGDGEIELTTAAIGMRDGSYWADDAIPAFIGLTADEQAVRATSGSTVVLQGDDLTLTDLQVTVVPWSEVDFSNGLADDGGTGTAGSAVIGADGSSAVVAPSEPGDYLVELGIRWQTTCLEGDGVAYGRIRVD